MHRVALPGGPGCNRRSLVARSIGSGRYSGPSVASSRSRSGTGLRMRLGELSSPTRATCRSNPALRRQRSRAQIVNAVDLLANQRIWSTELTNFRRHVMAVLPAPAAPTHELGQARFTSLATPSRGSRETAVWRVEVAPGTPADSHSLTREEVFVVLAGEASVEIDGVSTCAHSGDAIVVPADVPFGLANASDSP